ncbi:NADP(H)-dependent aldo-keto reductase [Acinetobacter bohemicus]|mgnify:FL=1|uniref:Protein tas n=1 Tax=Acinetobacter lwoffii TaxID=28090 RepID=A0A9D2USW0_ACILW|nr:MULTISPECIES: NADP(H)-dependent aldo-keto reductase [Acinetobacter]MDM1782722.1 NADP(H)-dependent aldo-keto reductase [Acinetobacter indicus]HJF27973.1 NADP(H)-dependent aldo-keto reductase [Acinetobacter lwoffii]MCO8042078.1 NADP(H)-dependent aldo-keto reductase [Acinetobacter sp. S4400-12]MCU7224172.1 NADP(H)-dependent aldo-keto reductase [Acinetobacter bohemicus]QKQ70245.1 NADP(H)-dependent aldo-keto reductase [Acinetobacter sp. 10FS3-1]
MQFRPLADTGILLPEICLGTMTFGEQNTQDEAFQQLDYALDQGLYFWDTAEMYPVPPKPETQGATEQIIGNWIASRGGRDKLFLASKIAGPSQGGSHIRDGKTRFVADEIASAIDQSLARLQTNYIDLYQLHWPQRPTNFFGKLGYGNAEAVDDRAITELAETLSALQAEIQKGRIRYIGLSNETPWGTMKFLHLAEKLGLSKFVSVQNPYNLLNRTYEIGMSEIAKYEGVGLLAYSPLAFGYLTGKFRNGARPAHARVTLFSRFSRYSNPQSEWATEQYAQLAEQHGLTLTQLALAFIKQQFFVTSTIIGATNLDQLKENIQAFEIELSEEVLQGIDAIHRQQPNPAP